MASRLAKGQAISASMILFGYLIWKGCRYSLSFGKVFEGVASRRLLLSKKRSGRDSRIRG